MNFQAKNLFEKASLAGEYYESFDVNSKNCMEQSTGTSAWIASYHRLLDRCLNSSRSSDPQAVGEAVDILFRLLDRIDECNDDILFFADEGGSLQVGVDWPRVLPVWFKIRSAIDAPGDFAKRITALVSHHYHYGRDKMLAVARKIATPQQRKAVDEIAGGGPTA